MRCRWPNAGIYDTLSAAGAELISDSCPDQPCWHYLKGKSSWENVKSWSESGNGQSGLIIVEDYYVASGTYRVLTTAKIYNSTRTTLLETEFFNSKEQTY